MNYANKDQLVSFESRIREAWEAGELPFLVHLCGGNEAALIDVFSSAKDGDWIFSTHRNHYHALLAGISPEKIEQLIREGRSMFVFDRDRNFYSSAILAGTCCIAAGVALQLKQEKSSNHVWCFLGDGAEEEGHFYEAALFVEANDLPCTFVIEDNGRQVDTPKGVRRGATERANRPLDAFRCVERYYYRPTYPHAGSGCKHQITFRSDIVAAHADKL